MISSNLRPVNIKQKIPCAYLCKRYVYAYYYASTLEVIRYFITLFHTGVAKFAKFYVIKVFSEMQ